MRCEGKNIYRCGQGGIFFKSLVGHLSRNAVIKLPHEATNDLKKKVRQNIFLTNLICSTCPLRVWHIKRTLPWGWQRLRMCHTIRTLPWGWQRLRICHTIRTLPWGWQRRLDLLQAC